MLTWPDKDPDELLDYEIDWSARLVDGDTISAATWEVPTGITEETTSHADTTATIWLSGGTLGTRYTLTSRVTTTGGRIMDQSVRIKVKAK